MNAASIPPLRGAIVSEITLIDQIERHEMGKFTSQSLPGHLLHVCTAGEVEQQAGGVTQHFGAGDAIWYFENEPVQGRVLQSPWVFYTVSFRAPSLLPPPLSQRVRHVDEDVAFEMRRLVAAWRDLDAPSGQRHLLIYSILLAIISKLLPAESQQHRMDDATQQWWELEATLRAHLDQPIDLSLLQQLSGRSQRSVTRACRLATGMSPMKRVKLVRLNYARGLAQLSELSMTEIAMRVGYSRVQELSRDYHAHFGCTPTQDRQSGPDYRKSRKFDS